MKALQSISAKQLLASNEKVFFISLRVLMVIIYFLVSPITMASSFTMPTAIKDQCPLPEGFSRILPEKEGIAAKGGENPYLIPAPIKAKIKEEQGVTVSLVNLWALWCPPCLKELPMLDSIANNPDFLVETIHLGNKANEVAARFKTLNIKHLPKHVEGDLTLLSQWGFQGLPATLVFVNQEAKYRHQGYIHQSGQALASWLSCLALSSSPLIQSQRE